MSGWKKRILHGLAKRVGQRRAFATFPPTPSQEGAAARGPGRHVLSSALGQCQAMNEEQSHTADRHIRSAKNKRYRAAQLTPLKRAPILTKCSVSQMPSRDAEQGLRAGESMAVQQPPEVSVCLPLRPGKKVSRCAQNMYKA